MLLDAEEFDVSGLESSVWSAGVTAGDPLSLRAARPCALSPELIEEALGQARVRTMVSGLPEEQRRELIEAVLEQLADGREELPEELNERVLDGMLGALIAEFWLQVLTDLKTRGLQDVLVCCVDGLTGFPDAIEAVYPRTWVQTCLVHAVRAALRFVPYKDKKKVAADLRKIYTAVDRDHAEAELEHFAETWNPKYPMISASWIENWERIIPFLAFPPDLRRAVYTTNTIEALNRQIRKTIKTRGSFPDEDSARKLLYLAITRAPRPTEMAAHLRLELRARRVPNPLRRPHTRHCNLAITT